MLTKIELRQQPCGYRRVKNDQGEIVDETIYNPDFKVLMGNYGPGGTMRQLGYVFVNPRPTINCCCVRCDPPDLAKIKELVEAETGLTFEGIGHAPEVIEEEDEEDEDEDVEA